MKKVFTVLLALVVVLSMMSMGSVMGKGSAKSFIDTNDNKVNDDVEMIAESLEPGEKVSVIAIFNEFGCADNALVAAEGKAGKLEKKYDYTRIPAKALRLNKAQLEALANDPALVKLQLDAEVQACMSTASTHFGATKARTDFGVTGNMDGSETTYSKNDVVVAVIDTGIYTGHVDLDGGKVIAWKDYVASKTTPYDDNGHGTHCAGIIAGTGEANSAYKGVAPGAALIGLKVLDKNGSGSMSNVDAAIEWCINNKSLYNIRVVSMSLGTSGSSNGQDSTSLLVNQAYANGLAVCVAAGNSGPAKYTIGSPGAAADAITVGAMSDCGEKGFFQAYFSSRGPTADNRIKPDISAPGYNITACGTTSTGYVVKSGTSMATPFVAGTVALMIDANPSITAASVKSLLTTTVIDFGPSGQDIDFGYGRLQTYEAVKSAGGFSGTGPSVPDHFYQTGNLTSSGQNLYYNINVTSTAFPIAVTFIHGTTSSGADFDVYLLNPSGTQVDSSTGTTRQETIDYVPTVTGTYQLRVKSYSGTGSFFFDVSCK